MKSNDAKALFLYGLTLMGLLILGAGIYKIGSHALDTFVGTPSDDIEYSLHQYYPIRDGVTYLILGLVIFLSAHTNVQRNIRSKVIDLSSVQRQWILYLILLICSVILIMSFLTTLLFVFDGDILTKWSKPAALCFLALLIFNYFVAETKKKASKKKVAIPQSSVFSLIFLTALCFIYGLYQMPFPSTISTIKSDVHRIKLMRDLSADINEHYKDAHRLPNSLSDIGEYLQVHTLYNPDTRKPLEYAKVSETQYKICGDFKDAGVYNQAYGEPVRYHKGKTCFVFDAKTQRIENSGTK